MNQLVKFHLNAIAVASSFGDERVAVGHCHVVFFITSGRDLEVNYVSYKEVCHHNGVIPAERGIFFDSYPSLEFAQDAENSKNK